MKNKNLYLSQFSSASNPEQKVPLSQDHRPDHIRGWIDQQGQIHYNADYFRERFGVILKQVQSEKKEAKNVFEYDGKEYTPKAFLKAEKIQKEVREGVWREMKNIKEHEVTHRVVSYVLKENPSLEQKFQLFLTENGLGQNVKNQEEIICQIMDGNIDTSNNIRFELLKTLSGEIKNIEKMNNRNQIRSLDSKLITSTDKEEFERGEIDLSLIPFVGEKMLDLPPHLLEKIPGKDFLLNRLVSSAIGDWRNTDFISIVRKIRFLGMGKNLDSSKLKKFFPSLLFPDQRPAWYKEYAGSAEWANFEWVSSILFEFRSIDETFFDEIRFDGFETNIQQQITTDMKLMFGQPTADSKDERGVLWSLKNMDNALNNAAKTYFSNLPSYLNCDFSSFSTSFDLLLRIGEGRLKKEVKESIRTFLIAWLEQGNNILDAINCLEKFDPEAFEPLLEKANGTPPEDEVGKAFYRGCANELVRDGNQFDDTKSKLRQKNYKLWQQIDHYQEHYFANDCLPRAVRDEIGARLEQGGLPFTLINIQYIKRFGSYFQPIAQQVGSMLSERPSTVLSGICKYYSHAGQESLKSFIKMIQEDYNIDIRTLAWESGDFDRVIQSKAWQKYELENIFAGISLLPAPEDSLHYQAFKQFENRFPGRGTEGGVDFTLLTLDHTLDTSREHLEIALRLFDNKEGLGTLDPLIAKAYLKRESEAERNDLIRSVRTWQESAVQNRPLSKTATSTDPVLAEIYPAVLAKVYPQRNFNSYNAIDKYVDHTDHLKAKKYKMQNPNKDDPAATVEIADEHYEGDKIIVSGIQGYRIAESMSKNPEILNEFEARIKQIQKLCQPGQLENHLEKEHPSDATTLEDHILDFFLRSEANPKDLDILIAYQLRTRITEFIHGSYDRIQIATDDTTREYIELQALVQEYGDTIKETMKEILKKIETGKDQVFFDKQIDETYRKDFLKLEGKLRSDIMNKLPSHEILDQMTPEQRNQLVQNGIVRRLGTAYQDESKMKEQARDFAGNFSYEILQDEEKWTRVWKESARKYLEETNTPERLLKKVKIWMEKTYQRLAHEIDKYEEIVEKDIVPATGKETEKVKKERVIKGHFSKNRENAHARMVADICLARDPEMWENNNYLEYVLFDEEREKCVGTTMLLEIQDKKGKFLLFCPNPSVGLVSEVSAGPLYEQIKKNVCRFAEVNGFDGVIVDTVHGRGTNREGLFKAAFENSCLRDEKDDLLTIDLKGEYHLGGGYNYQKNLHFVWKREKK